MVAFGTYHDGRVEIEGSPAIPEGARLQILVLSEPGETSVGLSKFFANIDEMAKQVPDSEWENLPADGGLNHDHYLYGAPKRS